jgi:virginiamycin A acetyltransferase
MTVPFLKDVFKDVKNFEAGDFSYAAGELCLPEHYSFIKIGKFCSIAEGLRLVAFGHKTGNVSTYPFNLMGKSNQEYTGNCLKIYDGFTIGNDVYIGTRVVLHGGCVIGDGAVVAAFSVLLPHTIVPPYAVFGGNPAKLMRMRFDEEDVKFLLELKWWDMSIEKIKNELRQVIGNFGPKELREFLKNELTSREKNDT